jgi:hypothetical protein
MYVSTHSSYTHESFSKTSSGDLARPSQPQGRQAGEKTPCAQRAEGGSPPASIPAIGERTAEALPSIDGRARGKTYDRNPRIMSQQTVRQMCRLSRPKALSSPPEAPASSGRRGRHGVAFRGDAPGEFTDAISRTISRKALNENSTTKQVGQFTIETAHEGTSTKRHQSIREARPVPTTAP